MNHSSRTLRIFQTGMSWLPEQPGNGLDRVYYALFNNFQHADVDVFGSVAGSRRAEEESDGRIRAFASDDAPLLTRLSQQRSVTRDILQQHDFDLVASHFALYTLPQLSLLGDTPMVVHFHGPWAAESRVEGDGAFSFRLKQFIEKKVYRRADHFIVLSRAFRSVLTDDFGIDQDRISIVPGGVEIDRFDLGIGCSAARNALGWEADTYTIVSVRRLARRMGLEDLIAAVAALAVDHPEIRLKIAGKGPIEDELRQLIAELGISDRVELLGYVAEEDLPVVYAAADVSVVPTLKLEGFGLITVESMASGTPCLVTPVGGLPEVVEGLSSKLVLPGTGKASITSVLRQVLTGQDRLPGPDECREYVRTHFDWKAIARKTRTVYDEVLDR